MAGFYDFRFGKSIVGEDAPKYGGKCLQDFFAEDDFVKYGRGGLSQNMVVMLPVEEYVALCEPLKADDHKHHADLKKKLDSGEIQRFDSIPLLRIRQMEDGTDAKVYGHDGRHRAMLMKELGFDKIPVRLYAENFCWGENCGDDGDYGSAEILQCPGAGLRGWPKWLWGQNDKAMDTDKAKFKFPVQVIRQGGVDGARDEGACKRNGRRQEGVPRRVGQAHRHRADGVRGSGVP